MLAERSSVSKTVPCNEVRERSDDTYHKKYSDSREGSSCSDTEVVDAQDHRNAHLQHPGQANFTISLHWAVMATYRNPNARCNRGQNEGFGADTIRSAGLHITINAHVRGSRQKHHHNEGVHDQNDNTDGPEQGCRDTDRSKLWTLNGDQYGTNDCANKDYGLRKQDAEAGFQIAFDGPEQEFLEGDAS